MRQNEVVTGLIADTHGLLRTEAVAALRGADIILHAGDIGSPEVIAGLRELVPVTAVRGNCDRGSWAEEFPVRQLVRVPGADILLLHDVKGLTAVPAPAGVRVVVSGHSHRALMEEREGVLYLNPGSAGRKRFNLPVTVMVMRVAGGRVEAEIRVLLP